MDTLKNPFSPGAGCPPPELVGRDLLLEQARILLGRVQLRRPEKSLLFTGLRGVGKTVLLNEIERMAKKSGYHTISIEANETRGLAPSLIPQLYTLLFNLNRLAKASYKAKRALATLRSFVSGLKVTCGDVSLGIDIEPEKGLADSGDLEFDLPNLFVAIGEAAVDRSCAIAIFIDEIQYYTKKELSALIVAMHKLQQNQLPITLVGAGLPDLPGLAGEAKSYSERLFSFPNVGALSKEETYKALQDPVKLENVSFDEDALNLIYYLTQGYPYFLQEWGYLSWNKAQDNSISKQTVIDSTSSAIERLDENFFRVRYNRLSTKGKLLLRAMAALGAGPHRIGDVAEQMGMNTSGLGPVRARLIKKGMIYSPTYGEIAFTVPLFDEFMIRAIPDFTPVLHS